MTTFPKPTHFGHMLYCGYGRSDVNMPVLSLGLWLNFVSTIAFEAVRTLVRQPFDAGIVPFDLGDHYGPPPGPVKLKASAGGRFRQRLRQGFPPHQDGMGNVTGALRRHLQRLARTDPLHARLAIGKRRPPLVHRPIYSFLNRWIEDGVLDKLQDKGSSWVIFSTLPPGLMLTKYLDEMPQSPRADVSFPKAAFGDARHESGPALAQIAPASDKTLQQIAPALTLCDPRVTFETIGVCTSEQLARATGAAETASG